MCYLPLPTVSLCVILPENVLSSISVCREARSLQRRNVYVFVWKGSIMVRREEDINIEQQQQQEQLHWRRRAERGRKRLSASVEDVLAERTSNEPLEEEESGEEELVRARQADARPAGQIPPRLSLQSRELAIPSAAGGATTERESLRPAAAPAPQGSAAHESDKEEEEKLVANRVLAAFARRVTASLAALGKVRQPGQRSPAPVTAVLPALPAGSEAGASSTSANASATTPSVPGAAPQTPTEEPPKASSPNPALPPIGSAHESGARAVTGARAPAALPQPQPREMTRPTSQRLAGRTTRVRLEAAPKLASSPSAPAGPGLTAPPQTTRPLPTPGSGYPPAGAALRPGPSAPPPPPERILLPSAPVARPGRQEQPAPAVASTPPLPSFRCQIGKSCFTRGQGEVAVNCPAVSEASVVLVTLTGDPGPVVVQYVSLQPGRGFTVHLSAPTQRETPFHYVVLESAPLSSDVERSQPGNG
jgi:hypothetical protein